MRMSCSSSNPSKLNSLRSKADDRGEGVPHRAVSMEDMDDMDDMEEEGWREERGKKEAADWCEEEYSVEQASEW